MNRILVLSLHEDRAGRAVALASELARRSGATVTLVRVLEERLDGVEDRVGASVGSIRNLITETETRRVGELADRLRADGIETSFEVSWGVPWEVVVELVERDGFDLVVKPASGINRDGRVFFGSTALHLFRRCPCPVWVVGDDGRPPRKIMAAIDPSRVGRRREAAARIMDWAQRVAGWSNGSVHAATAWHVPFAELLGDDLSEGDHKTMWEEARAAAERDLDNVLRESALGDAPDRVHLIEGPPQDALPRFAEDEEIELIVMGTRGHASRIGDLLGETAETIIRQVRSSVLTIPPAASRG